MYKINNKNNTKSQSISGTVSRSSLKNTGIFQFWNVEQDILWRSVIWKVLRCCVQVGEEDVGNKSGFSSFRQYFVKNRNSLELQSFFVILSVSLCPGQLVLYLSRQNYKETDSYRCCWVMEWGGALDETWFVKLIYTVWVNI